MDASDNKKILRNFPNLPPTPFMESLWVLPPPAAYEPMELSSCGITRRDRNYRIVSSGRKYYVIEYIIAGRGHLFIDNRHFQPAAGDFYILPPNMAHEYYTVASDPWEKIWFNISGELIDALISCYNLNGAVYLQQTGMEHFFRQGMDLVERCPGNVYSALAGVITEILATAARLCGENIGNVSMESARIKNYIDTNWNEQFSLKKLCQISGKSAAQTLRVFSRDYGTTPGAYFQKRRFMIAVNYLEKTSSSVRDIAVILGFANEFHFSQWFKKRCGLSPGIYRKQHRTENSL